MIVVVAGASAWAGLVMGRHVAMDDIVVLPIWGLDPVDVLGWKEGHAKHTERGEARQEPAQTVVQHHIGIIGASGL